MTGKKNRGRILVMDDEKALAEATAVMLGHIGWQAEISSDGREAIELFVHGKERGRPFDAVILDINIPGGMGGGDTIKHLLEIDPGIKAIVSSGQCNHPFINEFRKYGFSGALSKPFGIRDLNEELQRVMALRGPGFFSTP